MSVQRVTITTYAPTLSGSVSRVTLVSQAVTGPQGTSGTGGDMMKADNLSGLSNYTTARSNLGLGTAATTAASAYATAAQGATADTAVQPATLTAHADDTTNVHGITDTAALVTSSTVDVIVTLTQAEYDALTPASTTLYVITG